MPLSGPQGQVLYSAHEAYDVRGRQRYAQEWTGQFTGRNAVPDLGLMHTLADRGADLPAETKEFLDADPADAEKMQAQRRREDEVIKDLVNALEWGKAECWVSEPAWRSVLYEEWREGTDTRPALLNLLRGDLSAVRIEGRPAPRRILIDKDGLDKWIGLSTPPNQRSPLVPPEPKPAHRPAANWGAIQVEFDRRCREGVVDITAQGWRLQEAKHLKVWFDNCYPEAVRAKRAPNAETIRRRLKHEFDAHGHQSRTG